MDLAGGRERSVCVWAMRCQDAGMVSNGCIGDAFELYQACNIREHPASMHRIVLVLERRGTGIMMQVYCDGHVLSSCDQRA